MTADELDRLRDALSDEVLGDLFPLIEEAVRD